MEQGEVLRIIERLQEAVNDRMRPTLLGYYGMRDWLRRVDQWLAGSSWCEVEASAEPGISGIVEMYLHWISRGVLQLGLMQDHLRLHCVAGMLRDIEARCYSRNFMTVERQS